MSDSALPAEQPGSSSSAPRPSDPAAPAEPIDFDPPRRRGWIALPWIVIVALVAFTVFYSPRPDPDEVGAAPSDDPAVLILSELQGRYFVGTLELVHRMEQTVPAKDRAQFQDVPDDLYQQVQMLNSGTVGQRQRFIVLAGEVKGPEEALARANELEQAVQKADRELTGPQRAVQDILVRLYGDYAAEEWDAPRVTADDRAFLQARFGWFGDLALAPRAGPDTAAREAVIGPALTLVIAWVCLLAGGSLLGMLGLVGLGILIFRWASRRLALAVRPGLSHGGIYAETFALWLLTYMLLSVAAFLLAERMPQIKFLLAGGAMFLSLGGLVWPLIRGVSMREIREDLGLTWKLPLWQAPFYAVGTYMMTLPLMVVGIGCTLLLMVVSQSFLPAAGEGDPFSPVSVPSHPIVEYVREGGWPVRLQLLFLASIAAPVVEETMFRGVLYRHLRAALPGGAGLMSAFLGATVSGFIFAIVHPQGWIAVPALMSIAYGLTLGREWTGSLLPSMIAHGLHNGLLLMTLILALR